MKHTFFLFVWGLIALTSSSISLRAQTHTGHEGHQASWFVGGVASYWFNTDTRTHKMHLHPEFGYFFNDTWAVGLIAGYGLKGGYTKTETLKRVSIEHEISLSPFIRYYYLHWGPFNLYVDGNLGYSYETDGDHAQQGLEVGLRPGACLDLTEGLCLCLHMGFMGYRKDFHGEESGVPASGFGLAFTPEHLMVGLELEF